VRTPTPLSRRNLVTLAAREDAKFETVSREILGNEWD
jgi:hypothetical protein